MKNDIYSIGQLIYYIFYEEYPNNPIIDWTEINRIYRKCVSENVDSRPSISELICEFFSIYSFGINPFLVDIPELRYLSFIINRNGFIHGNIKKTIEYLTISAEQGNQIAQFNLGFILYEGKYIERNINKAVNYFYNSAIQNNPYAQFLLGLMYHSGHKIKHDIEKAIYYYQLAADQNLLEAQLNLAIIFEIDQDIEKAIQYCKLAANQNHFYAQYTLGSIYFKKRISWYRKCNLLFYTCSKLEYARSTIYSWYLIYWQ